MFAATRAYRAYARAHSSRRAGRAANTPCASRHASHCALGLGAASSRHPGSSRRPAPTHSAEAPLAVSVLIHFAEASHVLGWFSRSSGGSQSGGLRSCVKPRVKELRASSVAGYRGCRLLHRRVLRRDRRLVRDPVHGSLPARDVRLPRRGRPLDQPRDRLRPRAGDRPLPPRSASPRRDSDRAAA